MNKIRKRITGFCRVMLVVLISVFMTGCGRSESDRPAEKDKKTQEEQTEFIGPEKPKGFMDSREKIKTHMKQYPKWILEFLDTHREAVDWVAGYPEYMKNSEEEIEEKALQPVELKNYKVVNDIPLFLQWDSDWGYASYGNGVIGVEGCGPTCLSMVAVRLKQDLSMTPKWMADFSEENGYYLSDTGTDWNLMEYGAEKLGIHSKQIMSWSEDAVKSELELGRPMICSMGAGDFTNAGHFIVLAGIADDGRIIVHDPNSPKNSEQLWDVWTLLNQMKAMWSFWV